MIVPVTLDTIQGATSLLFRVGLADLASWQEAGIAFGFVAVVLLVGFLLERLGVGLHA